MSPVARRLSLIFFYFRQFQWQLQIFWTVCLTWLFNFSQCRNLINSWFWMWTRTAGSLSRAAGCRDAYSVRLQWWMGRLVTHRALPSDRNARLTNVSAAQQTPLASGRAARPGPSQCSSHAGAEESRNHRHLYYSTFGELTDQLNKYCVCARGKTIVCCTIRWTVRKYLTRVKSLKQEVRPWQTASRYVPITLNCIRRNWIRHGHWSN